MVKAVFCMPGCTYSREFLLAWSDLLMQATARGHQIMISQQYSSVVHFARTKCLGGDVTKGADQKPFQGQIDYDIMFWVDSDIVFKPEDFFNLIESPHDVVGGLYLKENLQEFTTIKSWDDDFYKKNGAYKFLRPDDIVGAPHYIPVAYTGMGWMMIRKGVVEGIKYPWFWSDLHRVDDLVEMDADDVAFCRAITAAGHQIYVDTKIRVGHQKMMLI
jgi:hypothetical protein